MRVAPKYIYSIIALLAISVTAAAQKKDSVLNRQVMVEREYTPTLKDASKVNVLPFIYESQLKKQNADFIDQAPEISFSNALGNTAPADFETAVSSDKKKGYVVLGAGTHTNLDGALGYRLVDNDKTRFNIFATHSSINGDVEYLQDIYDKKKVKAKYGNTTVNGTFNHSFSYADLSLLAVYQNLAYNYYGCSFILPEANNPYNYTSNQAIGAFNFGLGLKSKEDAETLFNYKGYVGYNPFNTKYGMSVEDKGPSGGLFDAKIELFKELFPEKTFGVEVGMINQTFNKESKLIQDAFHGYSNVTVAPYAFFEGSIWQLRLGGKVQSVFDVKNKVSVTPDIDLRVKAGEKNVFYTTLGGGVNNNTFMDIIRENRYVNLQGRVESSLTTYDIKGGFKTGALNGFEFDVFGGYKHTKNDHLYAYLSSETLMSPTTWGNVATPIYADISTGHFGGLAKTNLVPHTDLSVKMIGYFYNMNYTNPKVKTYELPEYVLTRHWGRPTFTVDLNADVRPIEKVVLSANYSFIGGRQAYFGGGAKGMKNLNELNLKGEYKLKEWVSMYVRANNVLFQKYELQFGYPLQSFNVLLGASFKF